MIFKRYNSIVVENVQLRIKTDILIPEMRKNKLNEFQKSWLKRFFLFVSFNL